MTDESCSTIHLSFTTPIRDPTVVTYTSTSPSTASKLIFLKADTPTRKRPATRTLTSNVCTRRSFKLCTQHHDAQKDRTSRVSEIEVLRRERLAYDKRYGEPFQALPMSEAYCRALEHDYSIKTEVIATMAPSGCNDLAVHISFVPGPGGWSNVLTNIGGHW
ncbi:hypothetical protein Tco_1464990 [Tanacetum coccineum]